MSAQAQQCAECKQRGLSRYNPDTVKCPPGYLRIFCWCGAAIVAVPERVVYAKLTATCGLPQCTEGCPVDLS